MKANYKSHQLRFLSKSTLIGVAAIMLLSLGQNVLAQQQWTSPDANGNISNANSGNVGIGTTTPNDKLEVVGQVRVSGAIGGFVMMPRPGNEAIWIWYNPGGAARLFTTSVGDVMTILNSGYVGIGTTTPGAKLDVNGSINVSGNINAKFQDVAEWVPSSEKLPTGTVVVLDSTKSNQVVASTVSYDTRVAGVISEQPGIALGEKGESKVPGRVRVKVDATRGQIHIGDLLVTSDVPGVAMKSEPVNLGGVQIHRPGT